MRLLSEPDGNFGAKARPYRPATGQNQRINGIFRDGKAAHPLIRIKAGIGQVPGIHVLLRQQRRRGWPGVGKGATPFFDGYARP